MYQRILLIIILTALPAFATDSVEQHELASPQVSNRHIIDYEELIAQKVPDEEITKIHHEEDQRLGRIMSAISQAKGALKKDVSEEGQDREILDQLYQKYMKYQDDNSERWSQGFMKRMQE